MAKLKWLEPALVLAVFLSDRVSKSLVLARLLHGPAEVFSFLKLTYVENTGVAFGMFRDSNVFFIFFSAALVCALLVFRRKASGLGLAARAGLALVLGGALGNLYDRIAYGFVVDFLDLSFFPAVFNVADSSITAGAFLLAIGLNREDEGSRIKDEGKK
jgi:signal peptidase II